MGHTCPNALTLIPTQGNVEIQVSERNAIIEKDLNSNVVIIIGKLLMTYLPNDPSWLYTVLKQYFLSIPQI